MVSSVKINEHGRTMTKILNKSEQELLEGSFTHITSFPESIPSTRRATDVECLREYLNATNPVTKASCFDILVRRLREASK